MAQPKYDFDMVKNIIGFLGMALAVAMALIFLQIADISAYFDPSYIYYAMGGAMAVFWILEMIDERKQLEPFFNLIAGIAFLLAGVLLYLTYFGFEVHRYLVYALAVLAVIWAIGEWFTE